MSAITDIISGFISGAGKTAIDIRTAVDGISPDKKAEITALTLNLEAQAKQADVDVAKKQIELDQAEAGVTGTNFFKFWVAGPRPFILWICGIAFGLQYVVLPIAAWMGAHWPPLDMGVPTQVVLGALGLGNIVTRTFEKINGAAGNH